MYVCARTMHNVGIYSEVSLKIWRYPEILSINEIKL